MSQGDHAGASAAFDAHLALARELAQEDPGDADWQRELSLAYERAGATKQLRGDLAGALGDFQASLAVGQELCTSVSALTPGA